MECCRYTGCFIWNEILLSTVDLVGMLGPQSFSLYSVCVMPVTQQVRTRNTQSYSAYDMQLLYDSEGGE